MESDNSSVGSASEPDHQDDFAFFPAQANAGVPMPLNGTGPHEEVIEDGPGNRLILRGARLMTAKNRRAAEPGVVRGLVELLRAELHSRQLAPVRAATDRAGHREERRVSKLREY